MWQVRSTSNHFVPPDKFPPVIAQIAGDASDGDDWATGSMIKKHFSMFRSKAGLEIEVREFCEEDFEALIEMYEGFEPKRAAQGLPPIGRERIVAWLRQLQKNGHNLIAMWDSQLVGHSMLCPVDSERAEFAIFLSQDFRNQGIGTGLTQATLKYARRKELRRIWLSVEVNNRPAIRVYRKMGFKACGHFGPEQEMELDLGRSNREVYLAESG